MRVTGQAQIMSSTWSAGSSNCLLRLQHTRAPDFLFACACRPRPRSVRNSTFFQEVTVQWQCSAARCAAHLPIDSHWQGSKDWQFDVGSVSQGSWCRLPADIRRRRQPVRAQIRSRQVHGCVRSAVRARASLNMISDQLGPRLRLATLNLQWQL